jgi:hypothetical protein
MLFLIFVTALLFGVHAHLKFTECQAEFYRKQHENENVVFETDGRPPRFMLRYTQLYSAK